MSETRALSWSLDIQPHEWIAVPIAPFDVAGWRGDVAALFGLLAEADEALGDELPFVEDALDVEAMIDTLLDFSAALDDELVLVAGLGLPGAWPLPVIVQVSTTLTDADDLLEAAGARGGLPVEAPVVDDVAEGDGIRVTRIDLDDDGALWAQVSCARRRDGADVVLTWRTSRLELVAQFSPLLEELLGHVMIETDV